jgi:outer membrane lipoprotein-sorting protein
MKKQILVVLSVLAAFSLLLTGCQPGPTAEEIVAKMREVEASTEDAHAVVAFSVQSEEMDMDLEIKVEMWEKRPGKLRAEVLEASGTDTDELAGVLSVTDGAQGWLYHPGENVVVTGALANLESENVPVDPQQVIQFMEEGIQWAMDNFNVELVGEQDLNGVPTYKLEFTPKEGEEYPSMPIDGKATLWVEQERWIALQAHFDGGSFGEGWVRVRSFEFNTGLDDALFQFEIPEGAKVINIEDMQPVPLTLDEAEAQAEFDLLVPTYVPGDATLIEVFRMGNTFVLRYDHSTTSFTVVQGDDMPHGGGEMVESVERGTIVSSDVVVRGHDGVLLTFEGGTALTWVEDGVNFFLSGSLSEDDIIQVAESLE